jgi:hypothetical protein
MGEVDSACRRRPHGACRRQSCSSRALAEVGKALTGVCTRVLGRRCDRSHYWCGETAPGVNWVQSGALCPENVRPNAGETSEN